MGVGAYTAVWLGGPVDGPLLGLGLPIWIWLPAAGIVAALIGVAWSQPRCGCVASIWPS